MKLSSILKPLAVAVACSVMTGCAPDGKDVDVPVVKPADAVQFVAGNGTVKFTGYKPLADKPVYVHYLIPENGDKTTMPVLFVLPGQERNAADYLKAWTETALNKDVMVFALEFPTAYYNSDLYQAGGVMVNDKLQPTADWSFQVIEALFDKIVKDTRSNRMTYDIWGHSAGAQFVSRFVTFMPAARIDRAVSANAGWYTLPDDAINFPYGVKGTPAATNLQAAFKHNMIVDLGTADTDRSGLNTSAGAEAQGQTRFERGTYYYDVAVEVSSRMGCTFNWTKRLEEGIGHDYTAMARAAAGILY